MPHPAMSPDHAAVVTGGASGIGLAAATHFARLGMKVCIADLGTDRLAEAEAKLSAAAPAGRSQHPGVIHRCQSCRRVSALEVAVQEALRRHRHPDEQCRHPARQPDVRAGGKLAAHPRCQSLGGHPRLADLCARHDRTRPARPHHQHRIQAGHHHAARRSRLQRRQGRREGFHRSLAARIAQHRGQPAQRPSSDSRLCFHRPHRERPHREASRAPGPPSRPSTS